MVIGISSDETKVRNLIIKAWRERWTDRQWGVHLRMILEDSTNLATSFVADAVLQQALNGPGPNNLVLSYLKHSVFSYIISPLDVLKSISQYQNFYKPFCLTTLLDMLDELKDGIIRNDIEDEDNNLELSLSIQATIYWLLSVMYSSLEKISDMTDVSELSGEIEDSRIVTKCRKLLEYFLMDPFLTGLIRIASVEAPRVNENVQKMCREILKFSDGIHSSDISTVNSLIENINKKKIISDAADEQFELFDSVDGKRMHGVNGCIQTTIMIAALLRTPNDANLVANDLLLIKQLKGLSDIQLYADVIHCGMIGLADAIGKEHELKFIGFTFLQLPSLLKILRIKLNSGVDISQSFRTVLDFFLLNESALDIIDVKLHCSAWERFLLSLHKNKLITDEEKDYFVSMRNSNSQKKNATNAVTIMLKAEMTVLNVVKSLDGDYMTQQDKIFTVISSMLGESFDTFLIAASSTGLLQNVATKLIKLNQFSKQVNGEGSKASTTRAIIFDSSFLALCHMVQNYGLQCLPEDGESFFQDWYKDCMAIECEPKSPDAIVGKCDQKKVELLLNQYLNNNDTDLKTSLVQWNDLCLNSVGVIHELLLAWKKDAVNFSDVKKVLDVFRSKICSLPVCIAAFLCSYIQIMPEEECGKARFILEHLVNAPISSVVADDGQDNFKDRRRVMVKIVNKMIQSSIHSIVPGSQQTSNNLSICDTKESKALFESCWSKRSNRGIMDVSTTLHMKNLLRISGPFQFNHLIVQRIYEIQHKEELAQWRDLSYGILHMDLEKCVPSFLLQLLPNILFFTKSEINCIEPQVTALISLAVDVTLSLYLHAGIEENDQAIEPTVKKRRIVKSSSTEKERIDEAKMEIIMKNLFDNFDRILGETNELSPNASFIFRFLKELAVKSPAPSILHGLSDRIINKLISIMGEEITPSLLLSFYSLGESKERRNCARAITRLKAFQDDHYELEF